jgi:lipopolysaccharide transport system ATP-binding protein
MPHFGLLNEGGTLLFLAFDLDPDWRKRPRPVGRYTSVAHVPGNLLSEGIHFVNCSIMTLRPNSVEFNERSVVSFTIIDSMDGDSARGDWGMDIVGVIRPKLEWTTIFDPAG